MATELPTITVHMGKACPECGKAGATGNGICLGCTSKAIGRKRMKSKQGQAVQARMLDLLAKGRS